MKTRILYIIVCKPFVKLCSAKELAFAKVLGLESFNGNGHVWDASRKAGHEVVGAISKELESVVEAEGAVPG